MTTIDQFLDDWIREGGKHPAAASDLAISQEALGKARLRIKHEIHGALTAPSPQVGKMTMLDVLMINCLHKSRGVPLEQLSIRYGLPVAEVERVATPRTKSKRRRS